MRDITIEWWTTEYRAAVQFFGIETCRVAHAYDVRRPNARRALCGHDERAQVHSAALTEPSKADDRRCSECERRLAEPEEPFKGLTVVDYVWKAPVTAHHTRPAHALEREDAAVTVCGFRTFEVKMIDMQAWHHRCGTCMRIISRAYGRTTPEAAT